MFLFKKLLAGMLLPLSLCVLLLMAGLLFLWFSRRQKTGKVLVSAGFVLLLALGYGWGFAPALQSLEREHPPLVSAPADAGIRWVVVLGGGTSSDTDLPLHARITPSSLGRLVEGIRLYRQLPDAKLVVSGGSVFGSGRDADSMWEIALALGVDAADIVVDAESQDTETQAQVVRQLVGGEQVILVTSASHMTRSVGLFRKAGVDVIPAPAHYLVQTNAAARPTDIFPDSEYVLQAQRAVHEYLGILWAKLRGRL